MHTVICAFDDRQRAEQAVERLVQSGFGREHIHLEEGYGSQRERVADVDDAGEEHGFWHSVSRFFRELFGDENESGDSGRYAEALRRGNAVLFLDARDEEEADRAKTILEQSGGAIDMDERAAQWQSEGQSGGQIEGGSRFDTAAASTAGQTIDRDAQRSDSGVQGETVVPVLNEQLQVGKREVQRGGVRVIQRVTETPVRELVRLREERAVVERRPADRVAGEADFRNLQEGTLEIRERTEEPVISKTARVVEEVVVGKQVRERTETVTDTVHKTDVQVEPLQGSEPHGDETEVRTRIRGATEDAREEADNAIGRVGRNASETSRDAEDLTRRED